MPRVIPEISQTEIGQIITDRMDELGMSIKELSIKTDITYEHIRRIVRGEGVPAKYTLKAICEVLNIPYKEAEKATITDKVKKKYGSSYLEMTGMKPTLEPISRVWDSLTHEQQQDAIDLINGWAKRNKLSKQS